MDTSGFRERRKQKSGCRGKFICWWHLGFSCFSHTAQAARSVNPTPSLGRGRLLDVLFGRLPSLHPPTVSRSYLALRRYCSTVRLPSNVHVTDGRKEIHWMACR